MQEKDNQQPLSLCDNDQLPADIQTDFDFATMALKGRRLDEANRGFEGLLRRANCVPAWCGLGLVKLQLVLENKATVEEASYCFEKARTQLPEKKIIVETLFLKASLDLFHALIAVYQHTFKLQEQASKDAIVGLAVVGLSAFIGSGRDKNLYSQLSGAAGTACGAYQIGSAMNTKANAENMRVFALQTKDAVKQCCASFCDNTSEYYKTFEKITYDVEYPLFIKQVEDAKKLEYLQTHAQDLILQNSDLCDDQIVNCFRENMSTLSQSPGLLCAPQIESISLNSAIKYFGPLMASDEKVLLVSFLRDTGAAFVDSDAGFMLTDKNVYGKLISIGAGKIEKIPYKEIQFVEIKGILNKDLNINGRPTAAWTCVGPNAQRFKNQIVICELILEMARVARGEPIRKPEVVAEIAIPAVKNKVEGMSTQHPNGSRVAMALIAIMFGALGIHKFMTGRYKQGWITLGLVLISAGGGSLLFGLLGIIEGIIYLRLSDEEFNYRYIQQKQGWF